MKPLLLMATACFATTARAWALHRPRGRALTTTMARGRRRRPQAPRAPRVLQPSPGGVPEIARCYPERYDELLREKVAILEELLASASGPWGGRGALPPTEVHESARAHFRMRADFTVWREGEGLHYVMFNRGDEARQPREVLSYPMGSERINALMTPLRDAVAAAPVLRHKINDVRFLTTTAGDALATITYNAPIGDEWAAAAAEMAGALSSGVLGGAPLRVVGRSRKVKLVVGGETVSERLDVPGRGACAYTQTEGAFTQPNAGVCEKMLGWAFDATRPPGGAAAANGDLCELYCGNGCFTVALAPNFRRVVATEISKASVALAERNLAANAGCEHARVAKLSAEEFARAHAGERFKQLSAAGIHLDGGDGGGGAGEEPYDFRTLFVDPPRAGLDETCRALARQFARVVYVSCNPETLARDVRDLAATHRITRVAAFDQFPYTPHLEAGVVLELR